MSLPGQFFGESEWAAGLAVLILCCGACAKRDGRVPVYPVRGQVLVGDRPAKNAFVVFHPAGAQDPQALRPYGHAGADGWFKLTTYEADDGAPAAEYEVSIVWLAPGGGEDPPDLLKGRYRNPDTSQLRATIREGPTELSPFKLTP
jgi:hypothetical protein